jgi:hypothetical protein
MSGEGDNVGVSQSLIIYTVDFLSFIEENHEYKLQQRQSQYNQPSQPGAPSQDLMSFWGMYQLPQIVGKAT